MTRSLRARASVLEILTRLELQATVPVPHTEAKIVDYDWDGEAYKFIVELYGQSHTIWVPAHANLQTISSLCRKLDTIRA
jgi:hypothetical protein